MKYLIFVLISLLIGCSTFKNIANVYSTKKPKVIEVNNDKVNFEINWEVKYEAPTNKKGVLIITNPKTKKSFKMSYKDFFIMKKGYKNWRVVEKGEPKITDVQEKKGVVYVKFNYFNEESKSILAGIFVVDTRYIKNIKEQKQIELLKNTTLVTGGYSIFVTILCIILTLI